MIGRDTVRPLGFVWHIRLRHQLQHAWRIKGSSRHSAIGIPQHINRKGTNVEAITETAPLMLSVSLGMIWPQARYRKTDLQWNFSSIQRRGSCRRNLRLDCADVGVSEDHRGEFKVLQLCTNQGFQCAIYSYWVRVAWWCQMAPTQHVCTQLHSEKFGVSDMMHQQQQCLASEIDMTGRC